MILQTIDNVTFKMAERFDFSFMQKYGRVFKVFDDQDSGNICFGVEQGDDRFFVKFAGAPTAEYSGDPSDAVERLKSTVQIYTSIKHPLLIRYRGCEDIGGGTAMIFDWAEGECMGRMYPDSHRRIMALPIADKLNIFASVMDFLMATALQGWVAIDFYDGSIMYDSETKVTTICDIDFFRPAPAVNDMGRMWGSSRFMSPEEYCKGEILDEVTNVFTLGQMGYSLFTDSDHDPAVFPLSHESYAVLQKAISPDRADRYSSIEEFNIAWINAL